MLERVNKTQPNETFQSTYDTRENVYSTSMETLTDARKRQRRSDRIRPLPVPESRRNPRVKTAAEKSSEPADV